MHEPTNKIDPEALSFPFRASAGPLGAFCSARPRSGGPDPPRKMNKCKGRDGEEGQIASPARLKTEIVDAVFEERMNENYLTMLLT